MADADQYINDLKTLRTSLVEHRRFVATNYGSAEQIVLVQEQIEAVDRAIADENELLPSVYESAGVKVV